MPAASAWKRQASSGTVSYRAPEAGTLQRQPGRALDVYAVAVMIYQMVEGRMPFDGPAQRQPRAATAGGAHGAPVGRAQVRLCLGPGCTPGLGDGLAGGPERGRRPHTPGTGGRAGGRARERRAAPGAAGIAPQGRGGSRRQRPS
ncbi:hypothetical protein LP420_01835 [Massilia sp. B-10]|nr:hypothetical protein LP420_01835 [Massilia sp. B-10]